jgi:hypothetical protein
MVGLPELQTNHACLRKLGAPAIQRAFSLQTITRDGDFAGNRIRPMLPNHRQQIGRGMKRRTSMDGRTLPGLGDN